MNPFEFLLAAPAFFGLIFGLLFVPVFLVVKLVLVVASAMSAAPREDRPRRSAARIAAVLAALLALLMIGSFIYGELRSRPSRRAGEDAAATRPAPQPAAPAPMGGAIAPPPDPAPPARRITIGPISVPAAWGWLALLLPVGAVIAWRRAGARRLVADPDPRGAQAFQTLLAPLGLSVTTRGAARDTLVWVAPSLRAKAVSRAVWGARPATAMGPDSGARPDPGARGRAPTSRADMGPALGAPDAGRANTPPPDRAPPDRAHHDKAPAGAVSDDAAAAQFSLAALFAPLPGPQIVNHLAPVALDHPGGLIVLDWDGVLLRQVGGWRRKLGRSIQVFDPFALTDARGLRWSLGDAGAAPARRLADDWAWALSPDEPGLEPALGEAARRVLATALAEIAMSTGRADLGRLRDRVLDDGFRADPKTPSGTADAQPPGVGRRLEAILGFLTITEMREALDGAGVSLEPVFAGASDLHIVLPEALRQPLAPFCRLVTEIILAALTDRAPQARTLLILPWTAALGPIRRLAAVAAKAPSTGLILLALEGARDVIGPFGLGGAREIMGLCRSALIYPPWGEGEARALAGILDPAGLVLPSQALTALRAGEAMGLHRGLPPLRFTATAPHRQRAIRQRLFLRYAP